MSRTRTIRAALLALAAPALAAACAGGDSDEPSSTTLRASAGDVTVALTVPDGPLPDGMSAEEIEIEVATDVATDSTAPEPAMLIGVTLEPSGTTFNEPLELAIDVGSDGWSVLALLIVAGDAPGDEIEALDYDFNAEAGAEAGSTVVAHLSHFSEVRIMALERGIVPTLLTVPPDRPILVGEEFSVEVAVLVPDIEREYRFNDILREYRWHVDRWRTARDEPWQLSYRWSNIETRGAVLSPALVEVGFDSGEPLRMEDVREPAIITQSFKCTEPGRFAMRLVGRAKFRALVTIIYGPGDFREVLGKESMWLQRVVLFGDCVAPTSQAEPSPTAGVVRDGSGDADGGPTITKSVVEVDGELNRPGFSGDSVH